MRKLIAAGVVLLLVYPEILAINKCKHLHEYIITLIAFTIVQVAAGIYIPKPNE